MGGLPDPVEDEEGQYALGERGMATARAHPGAVFISTRVPPPCADLSPGPQRGVSRPAASLEQERPAPFWCSPFQA